MSKGVVLFAQNNHTIDYVKQAIFCAKKIKKHLNLSVAIATDNVEYLETTYPYYKKYIDDVVIDVFVVTPTLNIAMNIQKIIMTRIESTPPNNCSFL